VELVAKNSKKSEMKDLSGAHLLPEGIKLQDLNDFFDMANNEYANVRKRMNLLDGADRSELWKTITAKFPKYQVLPETNHINYIKENLVASIYTVGKYAELLPKSQEQVETCNKINRVLSTIWENIHVAKYERKAGERAALFNLGITQVGWNKEVLGGTNSYFYRGDVVLKNIDPMKYMRDPYADCLDHSRFVVVWDDYHITTLRTLPIYKERLDELYKVYGDNLGAEESSLSYEANNNRAKSNKAQNKYHLLQTFWVKYMDEGQKVQIAEIHVLDKKYVLYVNEKIAPVSFPFAELYCNEPGSDIIGVSEPAKVFKNYIAYNMLSSIVATHAYKAQRPPRFVNTQSGINIRQFAQYGADADKTFPVNGDASQAVHYGKFPDLPPTIDVLSQRLEYDIKDKSGVTDQYAGKDTNSVQTTGGMDALISRATGRDEVKIQLYEEYTKKLTELIVQFYIRYGDKRTYAVKDLTTNNVKNEEVNFADIPNNIGFDYSINIQTELPRNKMRLAQAANILLEKQVQYKPTPEIITMEEWLLMQDIPFKDLIMSRINIQRNNDMTEQVTQILFQFAGLIEQGVDPEEALTMVTDTMQQAQNPEAAMAGDQAALGNQAGAGSFQEMQAASNEGSQQF
jgi:hypothetical protein